MDDKEKQSAFDFLFRLQKKLNSEMLAPLAVQELIGRIRAKPMYERTPKELLACNENLCFYLALPHVFSSMTEVHGINAVSARQSLLCEYYTKFPEFSSGNSYRRQGFPFGKDTTKSTAEILKGWRNPYKSPPENQAYPDLCLSHPFPFRTIFEAKYFNTNNLNAAEKALVTGVREIAYYLGLPWDYEYGCLVVYDASENNLFQAAWESIAAKRLFWDDGNIFVMTVRGTSAT